MEQIKQTIGSRVGIKTEQEIVLCEHCGQERKRQLFKPEWSDRFIRLSPDPCECAGAVKERQAQSEQKEKERYAEEAKRFESTIRYLYMDSMIGERFANRTFENYRINNPEQKKAYERALKYAQNFSQYRKKGKGLFLTGTPGTGKTHLAAAIANALLKNMTSAMFGTATTLLGRIRQSYGEDSVDSEARVLDKLTRVDLLVIDDLGKEYVKRGADGWSWVHEKLYEVINRRYEDYKPIIVTTNLSIEALEKKTDPAIVSRIIETCSGIKCNWNDYRKVGV